QLYDGSSFLLSVVPGCDVPQIGLVSILLEKWLRLTSSTPRERRMAQIKTFGIIHPGNPNSYYRCTNEIISTYQLDLQKMSVSYLPYKIILTLHFYYPTQ